MLQLGSDVELGRIAHSVRQMFDAGVHGLPRFGWVHRHLGGLCSTATAALFDALTEGGFRPTIWMGCGHWFIVCDGWLIDVTATQFGQPAVVVRRYDRLISDLNEGMLGGMDWWRGTSSYDSLEKAGLLAERPVVEQIRRMAERSRDKGR